MIVDNGRFRYKFDMPVEEPDSEGDTPRVDEGESTIHGGGEQ